jgi:hypothetical protein
MNSPSKSTQEKLEKIGRTATNESETSIRKLFVDSGVPPFDPLVQAFHLYGGYVLPFELDGRFKIARAKRALRMLRLYGVVSSDPLQLRMPFGESKTVQAFYTMDGLGRIYEDERRIAESLADWVEEWAKRT